jgi:glycosyltransferase involved in cell wall biosynthesis
LRFWYAINNGVVNLVQITPGAGGMFCGNCFRDNALVAAWRRLGHEALLVPLYLPLRLDEPDQSAGVPIFFSGINVYLDHKSALFRKAPAWVRRLLSRPWLLRWAAGRAAKTRAEEAGELTLSMLRGEEGNQVAELNQLIAWLQTQPRPEVVCLSNALLVGLVRALKRALRVPVVCLLEGEDTFLDALPESVRPAAWRTVAERAADIDLFITPSTYFAQLMTGRLGLDPARVRVVPNGINLDGYTPSLQQLDPPVLGYFARMCPQKGLGTLVEAYLLLRQRNPSRPVRLRIGGGCGPSDQPFVDQMRHRLQTAGLLDQVEFRPNLDRAAKLAFYSSLSVFSVPASYGEAFGLYVLEAWAAGVPVVQPRHGAFPELIEATGGGLLCEPNNPQALAQTIETLLANPAQARALGQAGRKAVLERFNIQHMARRYLDLFAGLPRPI